MIGEGFEYPEEICGAVVSKRSGGKTRIALWTKYAEAEERTREVGRQWKRQCNLTTIDYQVRTGYARVAAAMRGAGLALDRIPLQQSGGKGH